MDAWKPLTSFHVFFRVCGPGGSGKLASFLRCPHHVAVGFIEEFGRVVSAHDPKNKRKNLNKERAAFK